MNRVFARVFKKAEIEAKDFNEAISEILDGNCISLGHKLFKKRIASRYKGKRGAYRTILYYRRGDLMVFMYLFAKNDRENITSKEMKELVHIADLYDNLQGQTIEKAINQDVIQRWTYNAKQ